MEVLNVKSVEAVIFCTELPVQASSKSVQVKCHPGALPALYTTELPHTLKTYRKHSSAVAQTKVIREYFTVWSTKLQYIFVVLQMGSSYRLNEAFVQIRDNATCSSWPYYPITDRMICAGSYAGYIGPCYVSRL